MMLNVPTTCEEVGKPCKGPTWIHNPPPPNGQPPVSEDALRARISESRVLVFIKGTPEKPLCRFSRFMVQALQSH